MFNELYKEVAEDFAEQLTEHEGASVCGADLAFEVFENYNADGSVTYNRYAAQDWIKEHFDDLGAVVEEMWDNWEYNAGADIFDNPEKFQVCAYLWVASEICGQLESVQEFWNDETELTAEHIEKITAELKDYYD